MVDTCQDFPCAKARLELQGSCRAPVKLQASCASAWHVWLPMLAPKEAVAPCSVSSMAFPSTSCAFQMGAVSATAMNPKSTRLCWPDPDD